MRTLGPGSLVSILKFVLDGAYYLLWGALALASLIMLAIMIAGLSRLTGLGPEIPDPLLRFLQLDMVISLPMAIAAIVAITVIVDRLRAIVAMLIAGDPFVPGNAARLRAIAVALAIYQLIRYATHGMIALVFTLFGRPVESGASLTAEFGLNLGVWFAVLALFVLSEVFREGARMRDEQKLTI